MFTKALVPLDGTEVSEGIIPFITQFARGLEMGLVLAAAVELPPAGRSAQQARRWINATPRDGFYSEPDDRPRSAEGENRARCEESP